MPLKKENQPVRKPDLYERVCSAEMISTEETETHVITTLRTYGGAAVICRCPRHTPEEERKLGESICEALVRFADPGADLSKCESMKVIV